MTTILKDSGIKTFDELKINEIEENTSGAGITISSDVHVPDTTSIYLGN